MSTYVPILISARDAGRLLDMLPARVARFAKQGLLPCVVLPDGELRFLPADLRAWAERHRRLAVVESEEDDQ